MADANVIAAAGTVLEEKVLVLTSFVEVCEGLDEESDHRWVWVVGMLSRAVHEAVQDYLSAVHQHALPHLRDLAAITRPNGGMGAMAPMGTQKADGQLANTRK